MASFLSTGEKAAIGAEFDNLHDTFARDIFVYVDEATVSDIPSLSEFNPLYKRSLDETKSSLSYVLTRYSYKARIFYSNDQKQQEEALSGLPLSDGRIRVKVSKEASDKMRIAKKIEVDDVIYNIDSDPKAIGPFDINYYMVYLKREN